jgi:hypothetical protein
MKKKLELKKTTIACLSDFDQNKFVGGNKVTDETTPATGCLHSLICTTPTDGTCDCTHCGQDCLSDTR